MEVSADLYGSRHDGSAKMNVCLFVVVAAVVILGSKYHNNVIIQESVRFLPLIGFNLLFVSINSLSFYFGTKEV